MAVLEQHLCQPDEGGRAVGDSDGQRIWPDREVGVQLPQPLARLGLRLGERRPRPVLIKPGTTAARCATRRA
jgi:hypothetical protein